ncbi:hypothetical protein KKC1_31520 [Calderihabitans maritimus]|uniref:Uncharacterized protein n=1 Tax=Calderihabitans maritimus TaxID=1246530 RepID=A0A1Z5HWX2_9FIRM|nr:hypothetical protein KKC1_31520 [Calderihabitans maritimus]
MLSPELPDLQPVGTVSGAIMCCRNDTSGHGNLDGVLNWQRKKKATENIRRA